MVDEAAKSQGRAAVRVRDVKAELDERRIARGVAIGLPFVTMMAASVVGVLIGASMAILVLAAGMLLGVIALFWASLRVLSGDAALSPELEALDATAHVVDALASRKQMLVRALKDLDNERALGKLEDDDHEQLSATYRGELKEVLKRIDASLEPHRPKAEDVARAYLVKAGIFEAGYRGDLPPKGSEPALEDDGDDEADDEDGSDAELVVAEKAPAIEKKTEPAKKKATLVATRVTCSACSTSNEIDASFCKKCGASLAKDAAAATAKPKVDADEA